MADSSKASDKSDDARVDAQGADELTPDKAAQEASAAEEASVVEETPAEETSDAEKNSDVEEDSAAPVKRKRTVAPVRKSSPTPKQAEANTVVRKRTTPVQFVKQSVGELKKVVWPTAGTLRQYFVVVLIFVLVVMFFVAGLDALFGWLLLLGLG